MPHSIICLLSRHRYGRPSNVGDQIMWTCHRCGNQKWFKNNYTPIAGAPPPKLLPGGGGPG